ncbi:MAG: hypothetical protein LBU18_04065 [Treponema sp.]|nr:hypothetical protein [Treponema sp.]
MNAFTDLKSKAAVLLNSGVNSSDKALISSDKALTSSDKALISSDKTLILSDKTLNSSDSGVISSDKNAAAGNVQGDYAARRRIKDNNVMFCQRGELV